MRLARTKFALEEIQEFLRDNARNPLIENYLVQYLLVAFYAEVEERVKTIISDRLSSVSDYKVAHFIAKTHEHMLKRVKKGEINEVLQKFGCGDGDVISTLVGDLNLQPYFDVITNRHLVSHQGGTNMTLAQVSAALPIADAVLNALAGALASEEAPVVYDQESEHRGNSGGVRFHIITRLSGWARSKLHGARALVKAAPTGLIRTGQSKQHSS